MDKLYSLVGYLMVFAMIWGVLKVLLGV